MKFPDHFSCHAAAYAASRPDYPPELFRFLAEACRRHDLAWDCATGNGQAARALAPYFDRVVASDASAAQVERAVAVANIEYRVFQSEDPRLNEDSIDLVTVAQALHWFDRTEFFRAVDRVLRRSGLMAVWSYDLCRIDTACDEVIGRLYGHILKTYWPPQRQTVERRYQDIVFPYQNIEVPRLVMEKRWTRRQLAGYLRSWSAARRFLKREGVDPLHLVEGDLKRAWGAESRRTVRWPLTLIVRRK